jgi:hypothetical protein
MLALLSGVALRLTGHGEAARVLWIATLAGVIVPLACAIASTLQGALAQEVIDVAAILNGLRALGGPDGARPARAAMLRPPRPYRREA